MSRLSEPVLLRDHNIQRMSIFEEFSYLNSKAHLKFGLSEGVRMFSLFSYMSLFSKAPNQKMSTYFFIGTSYKFVNK